MYIYIYIYIEREREREREREEQVRLAVTLAERAQKYKKRRQEWNYGREGSKCMLSKQLLNSDAMDEQRERFFFFFEGEERENFSQTNSAKC